jgi:DNA-directed RNA polymerase subunit beta
VLSAQATIPGQRVKKSYAKIPSAHPLPNLIQVQLDSFRWFQEEGLKELLREFSPIEDFSGARFELHFLDYEFRKPKHSEEECREWDMTYSAPLYVRVRLLIKETGELKEQDIFMGDFPLMTPNGVFIINGAERVVVSQLIRSPGVYFTLEEDLASGRELCFAKLIPEHGAWLEFETSSKDVLSVKVDGKRRIPLTTLLRAIGYGSDEKLQELFYGVDDSEQHSFIRTTIAREPQVKGETEALIDIYNRLRPGDPPNIDNAREWIRNLFFNARRYDLGKVGRYKLNKRLGRELLFVSSKSNKLIARQVLQLILREVLRQPIEEPGKLTPEETSKAVEKAVFQLLAKRPEQALSREELIALLFYFRFAAEQKAESGEAALLHQELEEEFWALLQEEIEEQPQSLPPQEIHRRVEQKLPGEIYQLLKEKIPAAEIDKLVFAHFTERVLTREDLVAIVCHMILVNNRQLEPDDIDHLGNRRLRTVGELIQNQLRIGFLRLERMIKERMSIIDPESATPSALINTRPVVAATREFFGGSQLSQFMDQTNPLAELTHKRRLSALGPGGLSRERAGFEVRDVHHSHYGRICPIETPEGPNIGLLSSLATYSRINEYGLIVTPYRKILREVKNFAAVENNVEAVQGRVAKETITDPRGKILVKEGEQITPDIARSLASLPLRTVKVFPAEPWEELLNRTAAETITDAKGKVLVKEGQQITADIARRLVMLPPRTIKVVPFVSSEVVYLAADEEENYAIAQANARLNENNEFIEDRVEVRRGTKFYREVPEKIDFIDVSPKQIVSVATSLIPFLEHDDANRALMGSNMQRQAVPLLRPESPLVETGMEQPAAQYSGQLIFAKFDGVVTSVTSREIVIQAAEKRRHPSAPLKQERTCPICGQVYNEEEEQHSPLLKFVRTNQGTCIHQRPLVSKGDRVRQGQVLADSSATDQGELALGQNVLCAFMSWEGYNFEDAIIISESLLKQDKFTSIHIERYKTEARETKLGPEEITRDIPNVGEESLRDLDEHGIIRMGAQVEAGDILVGKITPKGETELTPEEKLLRAIFGEKARDVKDTSLRVPHGEWGTVIEVKASAEDKHNELPVGVNQSVRVWVAQKRKITVGDKLAGRHGNKGVIARILPEEDMPFLPDGTPVEIILNPIGVPSRMNIGQVLEAHLGWAARKLGFKAVSPVFEGANNVDIEDALARVWIAQQAGAIEVHPDAEQTSLRWDRVESWLAARGYDAERIFGDQYSGEARRACLRLWLQDSGIDTTSLSDEELFTVAEQVSKEKKIPSPLEGKTILYDGRTGEPFDQPVTVGYIYMMKLIHLVEDKIHARSTGPYSLITQQPLGGKAQFGGQRFGEMEVWALEAYGAAYVLQELLTVKSDDVSGRAKAYESIIKGEDILPPGLPESFKVLVKELQSLGLAVETISEAERIELPEEALSMSLLDSDSVA